jgi:PEP-CTERM motif
VFEIRRLKMRKLFILGVSSLFLGSPAMSATYSVDGGSTGSETQGSSGDTPRSVGGGGNAAGFGGTFSATATNVGGGSVTASASEGITDVNSYIFSGAGRVQGSSEAAVDYTFEIVGPTNGAFPVLIPVAVTMVAHVDAPSLPFEDGSDFAPSIVEFSDAAVVLSYTNFFSDEPLLPAVGVGTHYDYKFFISGDTGSAPPVVDAQTDRFDGVVMMAGNEPIKVGVFAEADFAFATTLGYSETASGSAFADPTFAIEDPAFANYTITGVPEGPAAAAAPEPATWAMMLIGFAGLGFAGYRKARGNALLTAARSGTLRTE